MMSHVPPQLHPHTACPSTFFYILYKLVHPAAYYCNPSSSEPTRPLSSPNQGFTTDTAFTGVFAVAWNAFVAFWTVGALASGGILFALFSAPFW